MFTLSGYRHFAFPFWGEFLATAVYRQARDDPPMCELKAANSPSREAVSAEASHISWLQMV